MMAILPLLAAFLQAGSLTLDKVILSIRGMSYQAYVGLSFPLSFIMAFVVFLAMRPPIFAAHFWGMAGFLLFAAICYGVGVNFTFYRALKHDGLAELETIALLAGIPVVIFIGLVFADERNFTVLIPALIASIAVVWSHWERKHFHFARRTLLFLVWVLVAAPLSVAVTKMLLQWWHPISLELVRSGSVAIIFGYLYFRHKRHVPVHAASLLLLTNALTTFAGIFILFSYQRSGVVYTALLFSIQPLLVYLAAVFFLKEKLQLKKALAFMAVLGSIAVAQVL